MTAWLALFFAIAVCGTWLARVYAVQRSLLDHPGERRSHAIATPRGGGISIVLVLLIAALALAARDPSRTTLWGGFAIALLLVAGIGWWDDHRPLPAWLRLAVHAMAAAIFSAVVFGAYDQAWLAIAAFVAVLVLTNVWNFMDGINGLAASQAALAAAGYAAAISGGPWGWMGWALVAACLGFLPFNFPHARVFLGDVGSGALGLAIAAMAVVAVAEDAMSWPLAMVPLSAFLIDAGLTLGRRLLRGERWWTAHAQHAYQSWARRSGSHSPVTLGYAAWTVLGLLLVAGMGRDPGIFLTSAAVLAWYTSGTFLWWRLQRRGAGIQQDEPMEWRKE